MQIKNFAQIEFLAEFELTKRVGEHSRLIFSAAVSENVAENAFAYVGKNISVATDDGIPIFFGRVETLELENSFGASRLKVSCVSLSILDDETPKSRIFHNPVQKISDVLNTKRLDLKNRLKISDGNASKVYPHVILQNQETNFQFIKRLAKTFGLRLWLVDTMQPSSFLVDSCVHNNPRKITSSQIISLRRINDGRQKFFLKTKVNLPLGQVVNLEGFAAQLVTTAVTITLEHGVFNCFCELEDLNVPTPKFADAPILSKTVKLHATVKNIKDPENCGRIQVTFDDKFLEDMDKSHPLLIPWRTPYTGQNGGFVFLPDPGDVVEVFFTNEDVFCCSALRENPLDAEFQNVDEKFIANNSRQRILFREKSLELRSAENSAVLNEQGITLTVGKNSVVMNEQGITVTVDKNSVNVSGNGVTVNGNSVNINGNTANVTTDGTLKLSGSKIELG